MNGWQSVQKTRLFRVMVICCICLGLIFWNPQRLMYPIRMLFGFVATPFESVFAIASFYGDSSLEFLSSIGKLKQDNEQLIRENLRLVSENAKLYDVQRENEFLRKELDLLPRKTFDLQAAEVIGLDQKNAGNWLLIDKGSADGIRKGMAVIVNQGVVVGMVDDVLPNSAKVILVTSPDSVINGVDAKTEARGIVRGQYGLGIVMDTVLMTDIVKQGDDVVTSGLTNDFPRGLFLGKVDTTHPSPDRLFQQVTLVPAVNFSKLRTVFVIKGNL
jgi:rod shape-determining protein MreC